MKKTNNYEISTEWICPYKTCRHINREFGIDASYMEVKCEKCGRKVKLED